MSQSRTAIKGRFLLEFLNVHINTPEVSTHFFTRAYVRIDIKTSHDIYLRDWYELLNIFLFGSLLQCTQLFYCMYLFQVGFQFWKVGKVLYYKCGIFPNTKNNQTWQYKWTSKQSLNIICFISRKMHSSLIFCSILMGALVALTVSRPTVTHDMIRIMARTTISRIKKIKDEVNVWSFTKALTCIFNNTSQSLWMVHSTTEEKSYICNLE